MFIKKIYNKNKAGTEHKIYIIISLFKMEIEIKKNWYRFENSIRNWGNCMEQSSFFFLNQKIFT